MKILHLHAFSLFEAAIDSPLCVSKGTIVALDKDTNRDCTNQTTVDILQLGLEFIDETWYRTTGKSAMKNDQNDMGPTRKQGEGEVKRYGQAFQEERKGRGKEN